MSGDHRGRPSPSPHFRVSSDVTQRSSPLPSSPSSLSQMDEDRGLENDTSLVLSSLISSVFSLLPKQNEKVNPFRIYIDI